MPKTINIYFGTQSGTSEDFANLLSKELKENNIQSEVFDLSDFDAEEFLTQEYAIFIVATYGNGGPASNARRFDRWLKTGDKAADLLKEMKYSVFGLGESEYQRYNEFSKFVDKQLERLGANRILEVCLGDGCKDLLGEFKKWKSSIVPLLKYYIDLLNRQFKEK